MAVYRVVFVLGLLASAGSLVNARHSIGMYGESGGYRGGDNDYRSQAYGSTERYYGGGDSDYTVNSERFSAGFRGQDYDYTASSEGMNAGYLDWDVAER